MEEQNGSRLSRRERDVMAGIARRRTNVEIAAELNIGFESVKTYVRRIRSRLGIPSRVTNFERQEELVVAARKFLEMNHEMDPGPQRK